jgi:hypothetical protein
MRKSTRKAAKPLDPNGELYQQRAFEALPLLVRQARAGSPIYYSDIARELGVPNPRNMNRVLGSVGNSLLRLQKLWRREIPPLQALVINKYTKLPGHGFAEFAPNAAAFRRAPRRVKRQIVDALLSQVYAFPDWPTVLAHFGAPPLEPPELDEMIPSAVRARFGGAGESTAHRAFKEFVAAHPEAVGLLGRNWTPQIEYCFPSGDAVDVLFTTRRDCVAVEVKSRISAEDDLLRGLFQCVKYQALLDASEAVEQSRRDTRTIYVLEATLPPLLRGIANTLGVTVRENVHPSPRAT